MEIRSKKAWAVVNKKKPVIDTYELYSEQDKKQLALNKDEALVQVEIKVVKK